jgi:hypothetical protein
MTKLTVDLRSSANASKTKCSTFVENAARRLMTNRTMNDSACIFLFVCSTEENGKRIYYERECTKCFKLI